MAYHDTKCPCGGKKERDTMFCANCLDRLKDEPEMAIMNDETWGLQARRTAAIRLLALARSTYKR